jgi:hypothetical protein
MKKISQFLIALSLLVASCASEGGSTPADEEPMGTIAIDDMTTVVDASMKNMAEGDAADMDHEHGGEGREWDGARDPIVTLAVSGDATEGWLIRADVEGFTLTGFDATEAAPGEGHLHIFIDGQLASMMYESEYLLEDLAPGDHQIMVTLRTNDHLEYLLNGEPVMAVQAVAVAGYMDETDVVIDISFGSGVVTAPNDLEIPLGSLVEFRVTSDVAERIHLHGYDVEIAVTAHETTVVSFETDIPGIFEVELEDSGLYVMNIRVQ